MRTFAAWMLGAGIAVSLLSGCNDQNKQVKPVEMAPQTTSTMPPPSYPTDAAAKHMDMTPPPMAEANSPIEPVPAAPEPEPVDTAVPSHKAAKAHKATTAKPEHKAAAHKEPGPKDSYSKPKKMVNQSHMVKKGETLQEISMKYYGTTKNWRRIYKANEKKIGTDPNKLTEGMKLMIP